MLNRNPQVGDLVYAVSNTDCNGSAARRGIVTEIRSATNMTVESPFSMANCLIKGAVVIPPEEYTDDEQSLVERFSL